MSLQVKASRAASVGRPMRYRGDPGLGSFLGKVAAGAAGFLTGGVGGAISAVKAAGAPAVGPGTTPTLVAPTGPALVTPGIGGMVFNPPFGGAPGVGLGLAAGSIPGISAPMAMMNGNLPPAGFRWNKTGYFLRDGSFVAPGTKAVRIRRRNSLNPRALSRAIARVEGAKRASKVMGRVAIRKAK